LSDGEIWETRAEASPRTSLPSIRALLLDTTLRSSPYHRTALLSHHQAIGTARRMSMNTVPRVFFGWRVVAAVFVLAMFGWGLGFYGPPVYLHAVREARGWSLALVSTALTVHSSSPFCRSSTKGSASPS
jgi:hypothetical protein